MTGHPDERLNELRAELRRCCPSYVTPGGLKYWPVVDSLNEYVARLRGELDQARERGDSYVSDWQRAITYQVELEAERDAAVALNAATGRDWEAAVARADQLAEALDDIRQRTRHAEYGDVHHIARSALNQQGAALARAPAEPAAEEKPQLCPKCNGQGHVSTPPWVPGDQPTFAATGTGSYICRVCGGSGKVRDVANSTMCSWEWKDCPRCAASSVPAGAAGRLVPADTIEQLAALVEVCDRGYFTHRWRWHFEEARQKFDEARAALAAVREPGQRNTHGRHCPCSACEREDWARPDLAPCGMHGPDCPPVYAPVREPGPTTKEKP